MNQSIQLPAQQLSPVLDDLPAAPRRALLVLEFILEAGGMQHGFVGIFRNLREGIEFEVEVAEFDKASEPLSETNQPIIDPDYPREEDPDWKLKHFRKLEKILKEEGLLD